MPIQIKTKNDAVRSASVFFITRKNYLKWYWSASVIIILIAGFLIVQSVSVYNKSVKLINESNAKMIEKSGIEIAAELNKTNLEQAKKVVQKKSSPLGLPPRVRNIFLLHTYIDYAPVATDELLPVTN